MIVLKSKYDELEAKFASVVKENNDLKVQLEASKTTTIDPTKLAEMEASAKLAVETCERLTKENEDLKSQVETLKNAQVTAEVKAQQITASQGVPPVTMTSEDISPKAALLSELAQIKNLAEQRKFYEKHYSVLSK